MPRNHVLYQKTSNQVNWVLDRKDGSAEAKRLVLPAFSNILYFRIIIFRVAVYSPALNVLKYTPAATFSPRLFLPSQ